MSREPNPVPDPDHAAPEKIKGRIDLATFRQPRCDMCGEPKDGRDHSGCDRAYPETLK